MSFWKYYLKNIWADLWQMISVQQGGTTLRPKNEWNSRAVLIIVKKIEDGDCQNIDFLQKIEMLLKG